MADGENKITIGIEAEVGQLVAGLKKAEAEVKASTKRMEVIASSASRKLGAAMAPKTVVRSFSPYGVGADSSFGQVQQAAAMASVAAQSKKVADEMRKAEKPMADMARYTSLIARGLAAANAATFTFRVTSALVKGEFDGISEAIRSAPFGLGEVVGLLEQGLNYAAGINAELYSESAGKSRRAEGERRQQLAVEFKLGIKAAELRLEAERATTEEVRDRLTEQAKLFEVQELYQQRLNTAIREGRSVSEQRQIVRFYEVAYAQVIAEYERKRRESSERIAKDEADRVKKSIKSIGDILTRFWQEGIEKQQRARAKNIEKQIDERKERDMALQDELSKAQSVTGDNFVRSIGTAFGEFKFAQNGAAQAVARAQIRATELLGDINENTKQLVILNKERDGILSLR